MTGSLVGAAALALAPRTARAAAPPAAGQPLTAARNKAFDLPDATTKFQDATTYNNFYEFGVNKDDPARLAGTLKPRPWTVQVDGLGAQAEDLRHRRDAQDGAARGARLLAALRRGAGPW